MIYGGMPRLTLANRITVGRILLVPVFIWLVVYYIVSVKERVPNEYLQWMATLCFATAALTDALDGYVARSRGERTRLGAILDPLADKALLLSGLILLSGSWVAVFRPHIPLWYVLLVITRDVLLILGAVVIQLAVERLEVRPRLSGKIATVLQMAIILWVLIGGGEKAFSWFLGLATVSIVISIIQYTLDGVRQLEKAHAHEDARASS